MIAAALASLALIQALPPHIEQGGWDYIGKSDEVYMFAREFTGQSSTVKGWVRFEMRNSVNEGQSVRVLYEYDCAGGRQRALESTAFSDPNLLRPGPTERGFEWTYVGPDTLNEAGLRYFCR